MNINEDNILLIEPSKWRYLLGYTLFLFRAVLWFCMTIVMAVTLYKSIRIIFGSNNFLQTNDLLLVIVFLIVLVLVGLFLFWEIKTFRPIKSLFKTHIQFFDEYIVFTNDRGFQYKINEPEIMHILAGITRATIVFTGKEGLSTFSFMKSVYGGQQVKDIEWYFRKSSKFTNDRRKIRQIIKNMGLRSLSMRNRLEYVILKNS